MNAKVAAGCPAKPLPGLQLSKALKSIKSVCVCVSFGHLPAEGGVKQLLEKVLQQLERADLYSNYVLRFIRWYLVMHMLGRNVFLF